MVSLLLMRLDGLLLMDDFRLVWLLVMVEDGLLMGLLLVLLEGLLHVG